MSVLTLGNDNYDFKKVNNIYTISFYNSLCSSIVSFKKILYFRINFDESHNIESLSTILKMKRTDKTNKYDFTIYQTNIHSIYKTISYILKQYMNYNLPMNPENYYINDKNLHRKLSLEEKYLINYFRITPNYFTLSCTWYYYQFQVVDIETDIKNLLLVFTYKEGFTSCYNIYLYDDYVLNPVASEDPFIITLLLFDGDDETCIKYEFYDKENADKLYKWLFTNLPKKSFVFI